MCALEPKNGTKLSLKNAQEYKMCYASRHGRRKVEQVVGCKIRGETGDDSICRLTEWNRCAYHFYIFAPFSSFCTTFNLNGKK